MRNQNKHQVQRESLKTFTASLIREVPASGATPDAVDLDGRIDALVCKIQSEEDSNEDSPEDGEREDQELPSNSAQVTQTPAEANPDPDNTDQVAAMTGSGANLNVPEEFGYENFHILNYHSGISAADPVVMELRQQYLDADDCLSHVWPAEFHVLQSHSAARLLPLHLVYIEYILKNLVYI